MPNTYPDRTASKRLDKARKAARALRDGGYRVLPLLESAIPAPRRRK